MVRPLDGEILGKDDPAGRDHDARAERVRRDFWKVLRRGAKRIPFAEDAVAVDPFVQALVSDFGAHVVAGSIRHVDPPSAAA